MPKINQEEYEVLKSLDDYWKWIARDKNGRLYKFQEKPKRVNDFQWNDRKQTWLGMSGDRFQFIQWEDESPYNIQELIEEYEEEVDLKEQMSVVMDRLEEVCGIAMKVVRRVFGGSGLESEETEVKTLESIREEIWEEMLRLEDKRKDQWADIKYQTLREVLQKLGHLDEPEVLSQEWMDKKRLINRVENYIPLHDKSVGDVINGILEIIKQLPELEVLSPEWIDENQHPYGGDYHVPSEKLEDILVPKQELPVIPKFVADAIEESNHMYVVGFLDTINKENEELKKVWEWVESKYNAKWNLLARAWLDGYTLEEEQKYYVLTSSNKILLTKDDGVVRETYQAYIWIKERDKEHYQLTEQEIKDYDERYWPFAVRVEELEE